MKRTDTDAALLLDSAADFVEAGWTTGAAARRADATCCAAHDEDAVAWCTTGALLAAQYATGMKRRDGVTEFDEATRANDAWVRAEQALKLTARIGFITAWNDRIGQTAANVAKALRHAADVLLGVAS